MERFLAGNRRFVQGEFANNREYYYKVSLEQHPTLLWIGCSDSRVSPSIITDSRPGEIFVHRNIANIVAFNDGNLLAVLEYAIKHLKIPDIIVCGHYGCGGIQALDTGIEDPFITNWLLISQGALNTVNKTVGLSPIERHRRLVEENIRLQLKHLSLISIVRNARQDNGMPHLHGWVYDLDNGEISAVESMS